MMFVLHAILNSEQRERTIDRKIWNRLEPGQCVFNYNMPQISYSMCVCSETWPFSLMMEAISVKHENNSTASSFDSMFSHLSVNEDEHC